MVARGLVEDMRGFLADPNEAIKADEIAARPLHNQRSQEWELPRFPISEGWRANLLKPQSGTAPSPRQFIFVPGFAQCGAINRKRVWNAPSRSTPSQVLRNFRQWALQGLKELE